MHPSYSEIRVSFLVRILAFVCPLRCAHLRLRSLHADLGGSDDMDGRTQRCQAPRRVTVDIVLAIAAAGSARRPRPRRCPLEEPRAHCSSVSTRRMSSLASASAPTPLAGVPTRTMRDTRESPPMRPR
ncbi:hypothetical protein FB451DRAFT_1297833 [Mycena latifolia]|nr:hypothetical protein FB451DRAFT_1297833 [Mycena latifolia]